MQSLTTTVSNHEESPGAKNIEQATGKFDTFGQTDTINLLRARFPVRFDRTSYFSETLDRIKIPKKVCTLINHASKNKLSTLKKESIFLKLQNTPNSYKEHQKERTALVSGNIRTLKGGKQASVVQHFLEKLHRLEGYSALAVIKYLVEVFPRNVYSVREVLETLNTMSHEAIPFGSRRLYTTKEELLKLCNLGQGSSRKEKIRQNYFLENSCLPSKGLSVEIRLTLSSLILSYYNL